MPFSFFEIPFQPQFLLYGLIFLSSKMGDVGSGRLLAVRVFGSALLLSLEHSLSCQETGLQGYEEYVFVNGLPPLPSCTSDIPAIASTPREHTQCGLRGDRVGEADQPGRVMEASVRAFSGAKEKSSCRNGLSTHVNCFLAVTEILMLVITGRSLLGIVRNPLLLFPSRPTKSRWLGRSRGRA